MLCIEADLYDSMIVSFHLNYLFKKKNAFLENIHIFKKTKQIHNKWLQVNFYHTNRKKYQTLFSFLMQLLQLECILLNKYWAVRFSCCERHRKRHTHTHTHIYTYIYIYIGESHVGWDGFCFLHNFLYSKYM